MLAVFPPHSHLGFMLWRSRRKIFSGGQMENGLFLSGSMGHRNRKMIIQSSVDSMLSFFCFGLVS